MTAGGPAHGTPDEEHTMATEQDHAESDAEGTPELAKARRTRAVGLFVLGGLLLVLMVSWLALANAFSGLFS